MNNTPPPIANPISPPVIEEFLDLPGRLLPGNTVLQRSASVFLMLSVLVIICYDIPIICRQRGLRRCFNVFSLILVSLTAVDSTIISTYCPHVDKLLVLLFFIHGRYSNSNPRLLFYTSHYISKMFPTKKSYDEHILIIYVLMLLFFICAPVLLVVFISIVSSPDI